MKHVKNGIEGFLESLGVEFDQLTSVESADVEERWRHAFAQNVKKETGSWIHKRSRWHGFSYKFVAAVEGQAALHAYQNQWPAPYVIFDENRTWSYRCSSENYPDLTPLGADIYVTHHNMKWTMAFTHEQPHIGPFFAKPG